MQRFEELYAAREPQFGHPCSIPSCIRPEFRLPLDQRILCSGCCEKMYYG